MSRIVGSLDLGIDGRKLEVCVWDPFLMDLKGSFTVLVVLAKRIIN